MCLGETIGECFPHNPIVSQFSKHFLHFMFLICFPFSGRTLLAVHASRGVDSSASAEHTQRPENEKFSRKKNRHGGQGVLPEKTIRKLYYAAVKRKKRRFCAQPVHNYNGSISSSVRVCPLSIFLKTCNSTICLSL